MAITVAELIEELKKYPENMRVVTECLTINHDIDGVWRDFDGFNTGLLNVNESFGLYTNGQGFEEFTPEYLTEYFMLENPKFEKVLIFVSKT